jgi:LysM repeat protein
VTPLDNILGEQVYRDNVKPLFNGNNLKKFGINYLEPRIEGLPAETEPDLITLGSNMTAKTKKWYENNINYENGSMQIKGKNLKVGQRLYDKDSGVTYYIEGVSQSFTMFSKWITTLTLTRGQGTTGEYYIAPETSVTPAETTQTPEPTYYIVDSGDTLWSIAVKFYNDGAQYLKIVQANPQITGDTIYKGQKLLIPDPTRGQ